MKIITLCGSTKFEKEYHEINKKLTLEGNIVISVGVFDFQSPDKEKVRELLQKIHRKKSSTEVHVAHRRYSRRVGGRERVFKKVRRKQVSLSRGECREEIEERC